MKEKHSNGEAAEQLVVTWLHLLLKLNSNANVLYLQCLFMGILWSLLGPNFCFNSNLGYKEVKNLMRLRPKYYHGIL